MLVRSTIAVGRRCCRLARPDRRRVRRSGEAPVRWTACAPRWPGRRSAPRHPARPGRSGGARRVGALVGRRGHDPTLAMDGHLGPRQLLLRIQAARRCARCRSCAARAAPTSTSAACRSISAITATPSTRWPRRSSPPSTSRTARSFCGSCARRPSPGRGRPPATTREIPSAAKPIARRYIRFWEQLRGVRVADDVPTRLVGGPRVADAAPPALAPASGPRLIVPGRAAADRRSAAGGIPILRGGITSLQDG